MESCSATLTAFIGLALSKKTQNAAAAAGKGIASAAEQASNAAQSAADQTGQAIGNIAGKAKGAIQSIGDAIEDGSEQKSIKYNTEFVDERNVVASAQSQNPAPEHMAEMLGGVAEGAASVASIAAAGAQDVAAIAGRAGEIADGVKQGVGKAMAKGPDESEPAAVDYNQTYTDLESEEIELHQSRLRSIDLLGLVTDLVTSTANTPKSFVEDIEEVSHKKRSFKESELIAREELDSARKSAASAGAGIAAGMAVAGIAPSAAMWIAATFGTASTGAAISTLSGVAAWIGLIDQMRIDDLVENFNRQDRNLDSAMESMNRALGMIGDLVVVNRGGNRGVHGFIAEVAECGLENAKSLPHGDKPVMEWANDNGPADLLRNGIEM